MKPANVEADALARGHLSPQSRMETLMRTRNVALIGALALICSLAVIGDRRAAAPAGASVPTALELADHGLQTVVGPDDEGSYRLIDPIGPGGVASVDAANEVFASTLQGGNYQPWQAYRDPFAPGMTGPPSPGPYPQGVTKPYGGGGR
jgi:hypothetical protein